MTYLKPLAANFNYYPRTMISLCVASYRNIASIPASVEPLGWHVVWGPAELVDELGVSYSLMYVARRNISDEYTVVIRGTNFDSWESWTQQDFAIGTMQPFNQLAPHAPEEALIAQGTYNGMLDLLSLADPITNQSVVDFLRGIPASAYLYVTGHSLGGTLTPPMFAYLNDALYGGGFVGNMAPFSFAGLTSGNADFAAYFNGLFNPEFPWRMHNSLDIAPPCWWSLEDVRDIYQPHDLQWGAAESEFLGYLFSEAAGKGYTQPRGEQRLPGSFDTSITDDYLWAAQALHQHHSTTYQTLINNAFPER